MLRVVGVVGVEGVEGAEGGRCGGRGRGAWKVWRVRRVVGVGGVEGVGEGVVESVDGGVVGTGIAVTGINKDVSALVFGFGSRRLARFIVP